VGVTADTRETSSNTERRLCENLQFSAFGNSSALVRATQIFRNLFAERHTGGSVRPVLHAEFCRTHPHFFADRNGAILRTADTSLSATLIRMGCFGGDKSQAGYRETSLARAATQALTGGRTPIRMNLACELPSSLEPHRQWLRPLQQNRRDWYSIDLNRCAARL
jgi:hypothetical protein